MSNYALSKKKALDRIFVFQAVEYGFLTQELLRECIQEQEQQSTEDNLVPLLTICKEKKYLTPSQVNHLMSKRLDASVARAFGESLSQKEEPKKQVEPMHHLEFPKETTQQFRAIAREEREVLEQKISEKDRILDRERKQVEFYRRKLELSEKKLNEFEELKQQELQDKQAVIDVLEVELKKFKVLSLERENKLQKFQNILLEKDDLVQKERQKYKGLFNLLDQQSSELQTSEEARMKWEAEFERVNKDLLFQKNKLAREIEDKIVLKQNLQENETRLQELTDELETHNLHKQNLEIKLKEFATELENARINNQNLETKIEQLNEEAKHQQDLEMQKMALEQSHLLEELQAKQQENKTHTQTFEAFKREKEAYMQEILQSKKQLEQDKKQLEQTIKDVHNDKQQLEQSLRDANNSKQQLEQNLKDINNSKKQLEQNLKDANNAKKQMEETYNQKRIAQEEELHQIKTSLESELSQYKQRSENLEAKLQQFQESLGNNDELEQEKNKYKNLFEEEMQRKKKIEQEKVDLEFRLKSAEQKMQQLQQVSVDGSDLEPGALLAGSNGERYIIQELIGRGGMGLVYSALRSSDENFVVVKTLLPEHMGDMKVIIRFVQEARTMLEFKHENLVQGYDIYQGTTLSYLVMEYLDGNSVEDILEEQPMIEPLRATEIVLGVARALEYLEQHHLVHRDVKPANIIITQNGTPKLVDFGIVKMTDRSCSLTTEGIILGTPYYLSPEQTYQTNVDIRSDIYSLGATYFHMVVGEVPFPGDNPIDVIQKRLNKTPSPAKIKSDLPKNICAVIEKMMNRNIKKRHENVTELVHELEDIVKSLKK